MKKSAEHLLPCRKNTNEDVYHIEADEAPDPHFDRQDVHQHICINSITLKKLNNV